MRFWLIRQGTVMPAGRGGKLKTMVQTFALGLFIMPLRMFTGFWEPIGQVLWWVAACLMGAAVVLTVVTGVDYVRETLAARRAQAARAAEG
jgi:phosphatidylglycerophosphate synthase